MPSRRDFFKQAAALTGSAALTRSLLAAVERASAIQPAQGSTYLDAEHIVVLMQENRSFDHSYGRLRGVRGFNDPRAVQLPGGKPVWLQTNDAGETYAPFRLNITQTKATWLGSLPHSWRDQTDARHHGNHDRWLQAKPSGHKDCAGMPLTLGFYDRDDLPFYYALADAFTICDQHFCSSLTGTTANRLYLWSGTVREKQQPGSAPNVRNSEVDYGVPGRWTTFPERLEDAGISWRIYQNELSVPTGFSDDQDAWLANFTDNPIEFFEQYNVAAAENCRKEMRRLLTALPPEIADLRQRLAGYAEGTPQHSALSRRLMEKEELLRIAEVEVPKWSDENVARLTPRQRALHDKAFTTNTGDPHYRELETITYQDGGTERKMTVPKGDVLHQFRQDVEKGRLPTVSWLVAPERFSDHPGAPWYGAWYVAEALNILTSNPEVFRKTIFILTYDENDGYFDHVPPFVPPDPADPSSGKASPGLRPELDFLPVEQDLRRYDPHEARGGPVGLGYRVPLVVASPWSRGGYVCSQVFDHTSVLRLMEDVLSHRSGKTVRESNISPWRRSMCGDLSSAFRPASETPTPAIPFPPKDQFYERVHKAQFQPLPHGFHRVSADDFGAYRHDRFAAAWMPQQEPGTRPATALPYQFYAGAALNAGRTALELSLKAASDFFGSRTPGAPFHVYTPGLYLGAARLRTRAYAVAAGAELTDAWALDGFPNRTYHLCICGPNGFLREVAGTADDPALDVHCDYEISAKTPTGHLVLHLKAPQAARLRLRDNAYGSAEKTIVLKAGAAQAVILSLAHSHRWYDFTLTVEGAPAWLRRFAGRVETGQPGISDPAMGRQSL